MSSGEIYIIIPCFNEGQTIIKLIKEIALRAYRACGTLPSPVEPVEVAELE